MSKKEIVKFKPEKNAKFAVLDCETDPFAYNFVVEPFLWVLYDGEQYFEFRDSDLTIPAHDCTEKLIEFIRDERYIIYAHNGGKFDYFFLLPYLAPNITLINGRIAIAFVGENELRDSYLILPSSLSVYKKDEIDYSLFTPEFREANIEKISEYCRSDCRYLFEWITKFKALWGDYLTIAAAGFNQIQQSGYKIPVSSEEYDSVFRQFYYGGRVEIFDQNIIQSDLDNPISVYDVNSMYPFAMLSDHPYGLSYCKMKVLPDKPPYFASITAISYGCLPIKDEETGKLIFPCDEEERLFHATGWEIQAGLDFNCLKIIKVHWVYKHNTVKSFKKFILPNYQKRLDAEARGDAEEKYLVKILLNAPYGKFGQNSREFKEYCILPFGQSPSDEPDKHPWEFLADTENNFTIFFRRSPTGDFFNVAVAASITGLSRSILFRAIYKNIQNILYCDTDSIILREFKDCEKFQGDIGNELGKWKYEGSFDQAYFIDKKMYALYNSASNTWKSASKGVALSGEQIKEGALNRANFTYLRNAPSFSIRFGTRFICREVKFDNVIGVK